MKTLHDACNSEDCDAFEESHADIGYDVMINTSFVLSLPDAKR